MYRYDNVKYNDILLSSFCEVEEVRVPLLPTRNVSTLEIASRDGVVFNGNKYESYTIEIDILIDCDTIEEQREKFRILKDCFDVDEPKPFFINEDKFILAITEDEIDKEPLGFHSYETTITLLCCEPYFYSTELKMVTMNDDKTITVDNNGKRPIMPFISIGFSQPTYFAQLELEGTKQKILVGKYPVLSQVATAQSTRVLYDNCEQTSQWTQSSASIDSDRTVGGTLALTNSGQGVCIGSLPSGNTTWKGACYRQNLDHAVDEFTLKVNMSHNSSGKNGDPTFPADKETIPGSTTTGSKSTFWKVVVTGLNVRSGASTKNKSIGTLSKGYKIKSATEVKDASGNKNLKWIKFTYNGQTAYCCREKSGTTYVKKYTEDGTTITSPTKTIENVMVTSSKAYIWKSAKHNGGAQCSIPVGEIVRVQTIPSYTDVFTDVKGETQTYVYYKLYNKYNGYAGYIRTTDVKKSSQITIEYEDKDSWNGADQKMGTVELYGFDVEGSILFRVRLYDDNAYYEHTRVEAKIGSKVVLKTSDTPAPKSDNKSSTSSDDTTVTLGYKLSGRYGDWNEFWGTWTVTRKKVDGKYVWNIQVQKRDGTTVLKTQRTSDLSSKDYPTNPLSYVVIYMGTNDTLEKSSNLAVTHVEVHELNTKESLENKNITYFKDGDILDIDCENHRCYLNNEPCDNLVDIGSRYFELPTGESNISVYSNDDKIYAGLIYREKWIGED